MVEIDCVHFEGTEKIEGCSAPLCPLMPESLEYGIWYADEEICRRRDFGKLAWVKTQRKIKRLKKRVEGYFNLGMLSRGCRIRTGLKGLDPDEMEEGQLRKWMNGHRRLKEISEERKAEIAEVGKRYREGRKEGGLNNTLDLFSEVSTTGKGKK